MTLLHRAVSRRLFVGGIVAGFAMRGLACPALGATPAVLLSRGPIDRPDVALTFDCGSDRGHVDTILDTLAESGIPASFGITGAFADAFPDAVRRMVDDGHDLMNHSYSHPSFTGANTSDAVLTTDARLDQLERTEDALIAACGQGARPLFRPPYGDIDDSVLADLGAAGFSHSVMWTLDVMGWAGWSQGDMIDRVTANHGNGYIYLMHVGAQSEEGPALPAIIDLLSARGYGYARVSEMAGLAAPAVESSSDGAPYRLEALERQNLRATPGLGAAILAVVPPGTVVIVVAGPIPMDGYAWYEITTPYGRGWIAGELMAPTTAAPSLPPPGIPPAPLPD